MGGTQKIQIRGVNSVTGEGEPLICGRQYTHLQFQKTIAIKNGRDYGNLAQDIQRRTILNDTGIEGPRGFRPLRFCAGSLALSSSPPKKSQ